MNGTFSVPPHKRRVGFFLTGSLIAFVAACSGNNAVPVTGSAPGNPAAAQSIVRPDTGVLPNDTTSILKKLTKDVLIGSTVDPTNGDTGPRGVAVVRANYVLKKGEIVVCNFADKNGNPGAGTTIELFSPAPSSTPATFVQSSKSAGCDGVATTEGNDVYDSALTAGNVTGWSNTGGFVKSYGSPLKAPLAIAEASNSNFYAAEYIFASDASTGGIVSWSINNYGNPKPLEVATGFGVNKGSGWSALGPLGLAYYPKKDQLFIADTQTNTVVYFTHASELLVKDEIVVQPDGKSFKCKYPGSRNPCGKLVKAGSPLKAPGTMAILPNGNIIVANTGNNQVIEMTASGQVLDQHAVVKSKTGAIYGLWAIGTNDSNTALYYTNKNTNTLHELEQ
ncbi:MAG TPA: hypothetical protein VEW74_07685 [Candidatus Nitrosotalea sp.]|nr:hypothetical protein [Candidatus Nitrosotalea sp.]